MPATGPHRQRGTRRSIVQQSLVLDLALGLGLRHREIRILAPFLTGMPAMEREPCLEVMLSQHVAGDPLGLPGSDLRPGVQEDLSPTRTDRDGVAEPMAAPRQSSWSILAPVQPPHPCW